MIVIKKVDNYKLVEEISKEKDFIIYLGINSNDKLVSIKEVSKINENEDSSLKNQLKILKELKLVNIIRLKVLKVLKVLQKTKENYYIISEYCNGGKLSDLLKYYHNINKTQLNEIYIQKIIRQVSSGLEFIHSKNIIHQGITLENIAINFNKYPNEVIKGQMPPKVEYSKITFNDSFTLKIGNMKYSKDLKDAESNNTNIDNPKNMAPEMLSNKSYNNKIDLWSLGVLTYELLTGEKPFLGYNSNDIHNQIME